MNALTDTATDELINEFGKRFEDMDSVLKLDKDQKPGYGRGHLVLACHAAFPIAVTPDMLYQIWGNFRNAPLASGATVTIDPIAVADVLLWEQWREIRPEVYELDTTVRAGLLKRLKRDFPARLHELAAFLYQYAGEVIGQRYGPAFLEAQQWTAMATLAPQRAAQQITEKLATHTQAWDEPEILRLRQLVGALRSHDDRFDELLWTLKGLRATIFNMGETVVRDQFRQLHLVDPSAKAAPGTSVMTLPLPIRFQDKLPPPERPANRLYALLVGIGDYPPSLTLAGQPITFPHLRGGADDARKVDAYLTEHASFEPHIVCLTDAQATRTEIVRLFREHLGQARAGDSVLFYFSGLGAQERADTVVWSGEAGDKLDCLACYCQDATQTDFLLADIELRYLIHELSERGPHIVTLFDYNSSTDATRNRRMAFDDVIEKSIPFVFPQREWNQFLFSADISQQRILETGIDKALPQGKHMHLSACHPGESALEVNGVGTFTNILLTVLKLGDGEVTYSALQSRTRQYLRNVYNQMPAFLIVGGDQSLQYRPFLNGAVKGLSAMVVYDPSNKCWQLQVGSHQEIDATKKVVTVVDLTDALKTYPATIESVQAETSRLRFTDEITVLLDPKRTYRGYVENKTAFTFRLHVNNVDGYPEDLQRLMNELYGASSRQIELEDDESKAHYVIRCRNGTFYITRPNDPFRPLVAPINTGKKNSIMVLTDDLRHIGQWEYLRSLTPDNSTFLSLIFASESTPLKVELFYVTDDGTESPITVTSDQAIIEYQKKGNRWKNTLRCRLTNVTQQRLYCAALYLTPQFQSFVNFLNPTVYPLDPGQSVNLGLSGRDTIKVDWGEVEEMFIWEETTDYLTFISSTDVFDCEKYSLDELPGAKALRNSTRNSGIEKGFLDFNREHDFAEQLTNGTTQQITLHFRNPEYNTIDEADLNAMLEDPDIADFAQGLYFDAVVGPDMQTIYSIKEGITVRPTDTAQSRSGGFIPNTTLNLVNWWGRDRRNKQFRETKKRFPEKQIIVSVGDSWFQHPLIKDTIDYLSQSYPVYCLASAGGTLRDNIRKQDVWKAIDEQKPQFLLISLGSNDLLGEHFHTFFRDKFTLDLPEGEQPARFLKPSFVVTIDAIKTVYRTFFRDVLNRVPTLQIIIHGYDYIIPGDKTKVSWVGKYLTERGIRRPADRQAVMNYIIDEYNTALRALAAQFPTVSYLDLRGTVRQDEWYDEVHPTDYGFQQIATRFSQRIDQLTASQEDDAMTFDKSNLYAIVSKLKNINYRKQLAYFHEQVDLGTINSGIFIVMGNHNSGQELLQEKLLELLNINYSSETSTMVLFGPSFSRKSSYTSLGIWAEIGRKLDLKSADPIEIIASLDQILRYKHVILQFQAEGPIGKSVVSFYDEFNKLLNAKTIYKGKNKVLLFILESNPFANDDQFNQRAEFYKEAVKDIANSYVLPPITKMTIEDVQDWINENTIPFFHLDESDLQEGLQRAIKEGHNDVLDIIRIICDQTGYRSLYEEHFRRYEKRKGI